MNLLIADDHPHFRALMKGFVSDLFTEIYEVTDGDEAVETFARNKPDWVLMDLRMKRLGGLEATERIIKDCPEARIIMVTQYNDPELMAAAKEAGARDYVLKDNLEKLRGIIAPEGADGAGHTGDPPRPAH